MEYNDCLNWCPINVQNQKIFNKHAQFFHALENALNNMMFTFLTWYVHVFHVWTMLHVNYYLIDNITLRYGVYILVEVSFWKSHRQIFN